MGDERAWSHLPFRDGHTLANKVALLVLQHRAGAFRRSSWPDRGSAESNSCPPGIDLHVATALAEGLVS